MHAAPMVEALIGLRILQGLAAAVMSPQQLSIIRVTFAPAERTAALWLHGHRGNWRHHRPG